MGAADVANTFDRVSGHFDSFLTDDVGTRWSVSCVRAGSGTRRVGARRLRGHGRVGVARGARGRTERHRAPTGPVSRQGFDNHPLRRIETPDLLASWLTGVGCESVRVQELSNHIPATGEFKWNLVLGSGFHGALSGMDDATVAQVRSELAELTTARGIDSVDATTLVATGVRAA